MKCQTAFVGDLLALALFCWLTQSGSFAQVSQTPVAADKLEAQQLEAEDWQFIENQSLRLGVKKSSGAAIGYVSASGATKNLVNHWDRGRLIQQSYYGREDGSLWGKQPWRWNPVQGGGYRGAGAELLDLKIDQQRLSSKSRPVHWATQEPLSECTMEQTIELQADVAKIHFRFEYHGKLEHPKCDQEIPAVFLEPELSTLVLYRGQQPWKNEAVDRLKPGWPNEYHSMTENWAAYLDEQDFGLGVYVPKAERLTCYRFGDGKREHGSCSYFAPLIQLAITPEFLMEYDVFITLGSAAQIRQRFHKLSQQ